ncbi:MAG: L,D-transpeptidase [Deltaproteobacteria bacterium]|nr:L,D-transpeptidase [Deltaproteobacteria bacterium]
MKQKTTSSCRLPISAGPFFYFFIFIFFFGLTHGRVDALKGTKEKNHHVPAALLKWPENGSEHAVLVDKSLQKVFVYEKEHPIQPLKVYDCSTGENDGPKLKRNDKKTPEGIYFFTNSYVKKDLSPIYGLRAFPIDYPNPIDKKEGREGYGIWFHGTNKPLKPKDSNGCIALNNHDIDDLAAYIKLRDTPVIISNRIEKVPLENLQKEKKEVEKIIERWRRSWQSKNIHQYLSFYHRKFTAGNKDLKDWKQYKSRLAKKYKKIRVDIDNLRIMKNDGTLLVSFRQHYRAASLNSNGFKRLYFMRNSNEWKIIGELFEGSTKMQPPVVRKASTTGTMDINRFLLSWKNAWENKDLKSYITCYDATFRSRGMDRNRWKKHRRWLNRKHKILKIDIKGLKIEKLSDQSAKIRFRQYYRADGYHDVGVKNMLLIKRGRQWKIKKEEWRPIHRKSRT